MVAVPRPITTSMAAVSEPPTPVPTTVEATTPTIITGMEVARVAQPLVPIIAAAIPRTTTTSTVAVPAVPEHVRITMGAIPPTITTNTVAVSGLRPLAQTMEVVQRQYITIRMVAALVQVQAMTGKYMI